MTNLPSGKDHDRRGRRPTVLLSLIAALFFLIPAVLYGSGMRASAIENHRLASFPTLRSSWSTLHGVNTWFVDALPGRKELVRWRAQFSLSVFGEAPPSSGASNVGEVQPSLPTTKAQRDFLKLPPTPPAATVTGTGSVLVGTQGWLYYLDEISNECNPISPPSAVISGFRRLQSILAASGRQFVFSLAPDKSTVDPQFLPNNWPYKACGTAAKKSTYERLAAAHIPGYVDSLALIKQHEAAENRLYYLRQDTHWNGLAAAAVSQALVGALSPSLLVNFQQVDSVGSYIGDLSKMVGVSTRDSCLTAKIIRPDVTVHIHPKALPGIPSTQSFATSVTSPLGPGRTLMIGDSFADTLVPKLAPFFKNLLWIHNASVQSFPLTVAQQINSSRAVIVVWNQRYFTDPAFGVLWSTPFLNKLSKMLTKLPAS
jgi:hypothetical protein